MARVLIVEDNLLNRELAGDVLEAHGWEVRIAGDGIECLAVLSTWRPDLLLMDVQLPDKSGLEITRDLRADPAYALLPIVAMTAHAMAEDRERAHAAGCTGYLTKPINTRTLAQQLEAYLLPSASATAPLGESIPGGPTTGPPHTEQGVP